MRNLRKQMDSSILELTKDELESVIGGKKSKKEIEIEINNNAGGGGNPPPDWSDRYQAFRQGGHSVPGSAWNATIG